MGKEGRKKDWRRKISMMVNMTDDTPAAALTSGVYSSVGHRSNGTVDAPPPGSCC